MKSHFVSDLAVPAVFGLLFHGAWSIIIIIQFSKLGLPNDCADKAAVESAALLLLACFVATAVLQGWLLYESLQGRVLGLRYLVSLHPVCSRQHMDAG